MGIRTSEAQFLRALKLLVEIVAKYGIDVSVSKRVRAWDCG